MPNPRKQRARGKAGAPLSKLAGVGSGVKKVLICSNRNITRLRSEIRAAGLLLNATRTETQLDTLLRTLQYLGDRGLNTPEAVGIGFARIATRVFDLEQQGWRIDTEREDVVTADGLAHRGIARYILRGRRADIADPQGSLDLGAAG
jgi:hypothetical protein